MAPNNWLLPAMLCVALAGCGKDDGTNTNNNGNDTGSQTTGADMGGATDTGGTGDTGPTGDDGPRVDMTLPDMGPVGATVETTGGTVNGVESDGIVSFKGIPYAAAPIGDLRFKPPVAHPGWDQPLDGSAFGAICPQRDAQSQQAVGEEDCLTLNVWAAAGAQGKPVMVFIHGGGFVQGRGSADLYDGKHLAGEDVVVVTLNYRLGPLGFLATDELARENADDTAGNYGLLDQIEALKWLQQNIAAFGGDPANVTLFGESAGGSSICGHLGSPLTDGLFDRAIIQSGGGCAAYPLLRTGTLVSDPVVMTGAQFVAEVECDSASDVNACLRQVPAADLVDAAWSMNPTALGLPPFGLNIDGTILVDQPSQRFRDGTARDVPIVTGTNADEATLFTTTTPVPTTAAYESIVNGLFGATLGGQVLDIYPASDFESPKDAYNHLFSDIAFICPALKFARVASDGEPSYTYHFTQVPNGVAGTLGATHGLELVYVFGTFAEAYPAYNPTADDLAVSASMMGDWVSFATDGSLPYAAYKTVNGEIQIYDEPTEIVTSIREGRCDDLEALGIFP